MSDIKKTFSLPGKEQDQSSEVTPKASRRRRAAVGGARYKLQAPERPGYVRRFVNDDPGRIMEMQELGYDFAQADTNTDGMGTRITRFAGRKANGEPMHAVLMETPVEEYAVGQREREEQLRPFEDAINRGADPTGQVANSYTPKHEQSFIKTGFTP